MYSFIILLHSEFHHLKNTRTCQTKTCSKFSLKRMCTLTFPGWIEWHSLLLIIVFFNSTLKLNDFGNDTSSSSTAIGEPSSFALVFGTSAAVFEAVKTLHHTVKFCLTWQRSFAEHLTAATYGESEIRKEQPPIIWLISLILQAVRGKVHSAFAAMPDSWRHERFTNCTRQLDEILESIDRSITPYSAGNVLPTTAVHLALRQS